MIINLKEYAKEVSEYVRSVEPLIDRASHNRLRAIENDLETGREDTSSFPWHTPDPISTIAAGRYDGRNREAAPVYIEWRFEAAFTRKPGRRNPDWHVDKMVTHLKIFSCGHAGSAALHFHMDLKNRGQLGPHLHMQISENCFENAGKIRLAVPRFPAGLVLPTDCLDFILAEFFPEEWPNLQAEAHGIQHLRKAQLARAANLADAISSFWKRSGPITPFSALQDCHLSDVRLA